MNIQNQIQILCPCLLLSASCSGTFGTLGWRSWENNGAKWTEIRTAGFHTRAIPEYGGASLGYTRTIYAEPGDSLATTEATEMPWSYGWCPGPSATPMVYSEAAYGLGVNASPDFLGMSVGYSGRLVTLVDTQSHQTVQIRLNSSKPEAAYLHLVHDQ